MASSSAHRWLLLGAEAGGNAAHYGTGSEAAKSMYFNVSNLLRWLSRSLAETGDGRLSAGETRAKSVVGRL